MLHGQRRFQSRRNETVMHRTYCVGAGFANPRRSGQRELGVCNLDPGGQRETLGVRIGNRQAIL